MVRRDSFGVLVALGRHEVDRAARDLAEAGHAAEQAERRLLDARRARSEEQARHEGSLSAEGVRLSTGLATAGDLAASASYRAQGRERLDRLAALVLSAEGDLRRARERETGAMQVLQQARAQRELLDARANEADRERRQRRDAREHEDVASQQAAGKRQERGSA